MKNKRLRKWALAAEILSAIAVIATLGFLALEMRENTNAIQSQTFQDLMRDTNAWRASVADSASVEMRGRFRREGLASLTVNEQGQVRMDNLVLWGIYESAFFANERGVLGPNEWTRFEVAICRNRVRDLEFWEYEGQVPIPELLTPQFVEYIENECD